MESYDCIAELIALDVPPKSVKLAGVVEVEDLETQDSTSNPLKGFEQKAKLADLACLKLSLRGSGKQSEIQIKPEFIDFGGAILPHKPYEGKLALTNGGEAPVDVAWADVSSEEVSIKFAPMQTSIAPGASIEVAYCVEAHKLCRFNVNAPLMVDHGPEDGFLLNLAANVIGPSVKLEQTEIDFGLLGVRETKAQEITFTNMSDIAAEWALREFVKAGKKEIEDKGQREKEISDTCTISFDPDHGVLAAHESCTVSIVCATGRMPQRLRTFVACDLKEGESQFCRVRGEVQAPKVNLSDTAIDLETVYITVPEVRTLKLTNLSNSIARFEWSETTSTPEASLPYVVAFEPEAGEIPSKGERKIKFTFVGRRPQRINSLFACDIEGMRLPLGFQLSALAKGLIVLYDVVDLKDDDDEDDDEYVAQADGAGESSGTAKQDSGVSRRGSDTKLPVLDFGAAHPIFTRKTMMLTMENHSAIPTTFNLRMKSFPAPAPSEEGQMEGGDFDGIVAQNASLHEMSSAKKAAKKLKRSLILLGNEHEATQQFFSKDGRNYIKDKIYRDEDKSVLREGRGVAFKISPATGDLPPWGKVTVQITHYNDMAGNYRDELISEIEGLPPTSLKVRVNVVGLPLKLAETNVGLNRFSSPPLLRWPDQLLGSDAVVKTLKVDNTGPIDCELSWKVMSEANPDMPVVSAKISIMDDSASGAGAGVSDDDELNLVSFTIGDGPDPPPVPYVVQPLSKLIPAYSSGTFVITFLPSSEAKEDTAIMTADAVWLPRGTGDDGTVSLEDNPGCLTVS